MGVTENPKLYVDPEKGEMFVPPVSHNVRVMSMGFLIQGDQPVIWRGPMIHSAVQQFLRDVNWGPLDYLVFDMPPGTGDAQLSLSQIIPLSGVVMVTTPQDVALLDVRKGLAMFRKLNVPVIGVVENMSYFVAPDTGRQYAIFGEGGGAKVAEEFGVPLLARIPLEMDTRKGGDAGVPIVVGQPRSAQAEAFRQLAGAVAGRVRELATLTMPTIR
jgi:ATP-binding protein involved in chromosome partitioning